jgi:hypothetical protein
MTLSHTLARLSKGLYCASQMHLQTNKEKKEEISDFPIA